jgi:hypothetical protein
MVVVVGVLWKLVVVACAMAAETNGVHRLELDGRNPGRWLEIVREIDNYWYKICMDALTRKFEFEDLTCLVTGMKCCDQ